MDKHEKVSPAPAGMIPLQDCLDYRMLREPRTRGDDPETNQRRRRQSM